MEDDRTELKDLADKSQPLVTELIRDYQGWAESAGVVDWQRLLPRLQATWQMADIHG